MSTLWYGLKQGIKSIIQNKIFSLAAIGTITACLFLLGVFYSLFTNFQHMVYNAESTVGIIVFFDEEATDQSTKGSRTGRFCFGGGGMEAFPVGNSGGSEGADERIWK